MPAFELRERLIPYRILAYLLYADETWMSQLSDREVRIVTGDAARDLRMKNANLWQALFWLEENQLVSKVRKEKKRNSAVIVLKQPRNITE